MTSDYVNLSYKVSSYGLHNALNKPLYPPTKALFDKLTRILENDNTGTLSNNPLP